MKIIALTLKLAPALIVKHQRISEKWYLQDQKDPIVQLYKDFLEFGLLSLTLTKMENG